MNDYIVYFVVSGYPATILNTVVQASDISQAMYNGGIPVQDIICVKLKTVIGI